LHANLPELVSHKLGATPNLLFVLSVVADARNPQELLELFQKSRLIFVNVLEDAFHDELSYDEQLLAVYHEIIEDDWHQTQAHISVGPILERVDLKNGSRYRSRYQRL